MRGTTDLERAFFGVFSNRALVEIISGFNAPSLYWFVKRGRPDLFRYFRAHIGPLIRNSLTITAKHIILRDDSKYLEFLRAHYENLYWRMINRGLPRVYLIILSQKLEICEDACVTIVSVVDGAAIFGNLHVLRFLLQDCSAQTINPFAYAAKYGHLNIIQWMVDEGAKVPTRRTVDWAILGNQYEIVKLLVSCGARPSYMGMDWAAEYGFLEILEYLYDATQVMNTHRGLLKVARARNIRALKIIKKGMNKDDFHDIMQIVRHNFPAMARRLRIMLKYPPPIARVALALLPD